MADIPEDKQKQLKSLNQDILAVRPERREESLPSGQYRTGGAPRRDRADAVHASGGQGARSHAGGRPGILMLVAAGLLALVVAALGWMQWQERARADALAQRVTELEEQLAAADQDMEASEGDVSDNVLQLGARMREMDRVLSAVANRTERLEGAAEAGAEAAARVEELAASLQQQQTELNRLAAEVEAVEEPPEGVDPEEFAALERRVERISDDVRSIFRLLESR